MITTGTGLGLLNMLKKFMQPPLARNKRSDPNPCLPRCRQVAVGGLQRLREFVVPVLENASVVPTIPNSQEMVDDVAA